MTHHIVVDSPFFAGKDGKFSIKACSTKPPANVPDDDSCRALLTQHVSHIARQQRKLYASKTWAVLMIFQAMDAAGKDGTIRAVLSGVDPTGCDVSAFKTPTSEELGHDFLWRTSKRLPERGTIGIFNRSYYEEVLVSRVHPEFVAREAIPRAPLKAEELFQERYESIVDHEKHLARNGVAVVKFFLHVSKAEQKKRFLARIDDEDANWKFTESDLLERGHWNEYQKAYEQMIQKTSHAWAPWYAIPADNKHFMRLQVAQIIQGTLESLKLEWPEVPKEKARRLGTLRKKLIGESA